MHSQQSSQSNLIAVLCEEFFPTDRLLLWRLPATAAFSSVPSLASNCYFLDGDRRPRLYSTGRPRPSSTIQDRIGAVSPRFSERQPVSNKNAWNVRGHSYLSTNSWKVVKVHE